MDRTRSSLRSSGEAPCQYLRDVVADVRSHAHRPVDAGGAQPGLRGGVPQRRRVDVLGIPGPAAAVLAEGIEGRVGDDAVGRRRHPGEQRRVTRVGDGRRDPGDPGGMGAVGDQRPQVGDLQPVPIGVEHVVRLQAVDRQQQHRQPRSLRAEGRRDDGRGDRGDDGQRSDDEVRGSGHGRDAGRDARTRTAAASEPASAIILAAPQHAAVAAGDRAPRRRRESAAARGRPDRPGSAAPRPGRTSPCRRAAPGSCRTRRRAR